MFRRAKISVLFAFLGALTAAGAALSPARLHPAFQPGLNTKRVNVVLSPAVATVAKPQWTGAPVLRITPSMGAVALRRPAPVTQPRGKR
jgi:hypothetical protein